ncbi:XRE family transcriptional regulator [Palleronia sediminis]|uniref:XRE family transcriptional regulator n=1 Tax=Palleronia sediminis TaxID=2547833 RepID=A0A4R6AH83_9RHOB|nr:helix-turn-helix transcriptional regulator [Palleronia sediminis]TDL81818.1 XRE family transcriptional regulator [Palleronia sediminis]
MGDDETGDWYYEEHATFGDRLADARKAVGMTQADLARRLGVKVSTLAAWENDRSEPRANRLSMLSGLLNVSFRWLLTGEGRGLQTPQVEIAPDAAAILAEMRTLRAEITRSASRLGQLEKKLRAVLEAS